MNMPSRFRSVRKRLGPLSSIPSSRVRYCPFRVLFIRMRSSLNKSRQPQKRRRLRLPPKANADTIPCRRVNRRNQMSASRKRPTRKTRAVSDHSVTRTSPWLRTVRLPPEGIPGFSPAPSCPAGEVPVHRTSCVLLRHCQV